MGTNVNQGRSQLLFGCKEGLSDGDLKRDGTRKYFTQKFWTLASNNSR